MMKIGTPTHTLLVLICLFTLAAVASAKGTRANPAGSHASGAGGDAPGVHEVIPPKYEKRYQEWKEEFLSTDIGKAQWDMYSHHPRLVLTITVGGKNSEGAGTGNYKWNDKGELIAATVILGERLDAGYPSAVYYPVMNALEPFESKQIIGGTVLAATKIAHEFGHVMKISSTSQELYNLQVRLVPNYNKIFLSNGYNVNDPRLVEIADKIGGNPVQI